jgi:hypothetical protein
MNLAIINDQRLQTQQNLDHLDYLSHKFGVCRERFNPISTP